jgi:hypothetical protein
MPAIILPFLGLLAPISAVAGDDDWQVDTTIYVWGAGIGGTTRTGGDIDISFGDLWDNLDMAFMGALEARKGKWGLLGDFVYMKVSADDSATEEVPVLGPITIPVKVDADVSMKNRIASFAGTYRVVDTGRATLSLLGGVRYFSLDLDMTLDLSAVNTSRSARLSESDSVWDGIVGIRGEVTLDDRWYVPYHVDLGTGESDLTWQAIVGVGYKFGWGDVMFAYRHLDYDFKSGVPLRDTSIGGPALGARIFF